MTFSSFYSQEKTFVSATILVAWCKRLAVVMIQVNGDFIDSSKACLKAVLLQNGIEKLSIPVVCEFMELLRLAKYKGHTWNICGDLKVSSLLLGLQLGYTKHLYLLCLCKSRDDENHYKRVDWPSRSEHVVGKYNGKQPAVADLQKVLLPPLRIKLGLMKNFVKGMDHQGSGFLYLKKFKSELTDA